MAGAFRMIITTTSPSNAPRITLCNLPSFQADLRYVNHLCASFSSAHLTVIDPLRSILMIEFFPYDLAQQQAILDTLKEHFKDHLL